MRFSFITPMLSSCCAPASPIHLEVQSATLDKICRVAALAASHPLHMADFTTAPTRCQLVEFFQCLDLAFSAHVFDLAPDAGSRPSPDLLRPKSPFEVRPGSV